MSNDVKLEPCPFCGGEAQPALAQGGGIEWAQVECVNRDCGAVGPTPATEAEAIAAWNRRHQPQREAVLEAINDWIYQSPPVGGQKVIIGCNFDDLADRIRALKATPAPAVSRDDQALLADAMLAEQKKGGAA